VIYFVPRSGIGADVVRSLEALGVFRAPLSGPETDFGRLTTVLEEVADSVDATLEASSLTALLDEWQSRRSLAREAALQALHQRPFRQAMAPDLLRRIPPSLDTVTESAVIETCERLGLAIEQVRGRRAYAIELSGGAVVDSLPGVPGGSSFVGTFDREEAVTREDLDFFASGHPLVEGLLSHMDESPMGRAGVVTLRTGDRRHAGIAVVYADEAGHEMVAFDEHGNRRDDWATLARATIGQGGTFETTQVDAALATRTEGLSGALDPARRAAIILLLDVHPERRPLRTTQGHPTRGRS
jgi:ATP-dependent helicase HepA